MSGRVTEIDKARQRTMADALEGDIVLEIDPTTENALATAAVWSKIVTLRLLNAAGDIHRWVSAVIASKASVGDTSSAGTASIDSADLTFVDGVAKVVLSGDEAAWLDGTEQVETITCTLGAVKQVETIACTLGAVKQAETIQCTAGESTGAGDITMTITAVGMANTPKAVVVPVLENDGVNSVGLALRTALAADVDVSAFFDVSGATDSAILTVKNEAANDATLAFGFVDTDTTGVTFGASGDTTAGDLLAAGDVTMTITSAGMSNSPKAVVVALTAAMDTSEVAAAVRAALAIDVDVSAFFDVSGADANVVLTAVDEAANDATLAFGYVDTDTTGATFGASGNTTAGDLLAAGNITMTITAAGMDNTPKAVVVALTEAMSINAVASAVRAALALDADVSGFFDVSGADADVVLTALDAAANDATVDFGYVDTGTTGATFGASTATEAGVVKETATLTIANLTLAGVTVSGGTHVRTFSK